MNDTVLLDETLDINSTSNYHLSIQAGLNGFSFCILDGNYNKYIVFKHIEFEKEYHIPEDYAKQISSIIEKDELLTKEYKSSRFINISHRTTVLPKEFSTVESAKKYFEFNHEMSDLDELHLNKIEVLDTSLSVLFTVPNYIAIDLLNIHPKMKFFSQVTPFIERAIEKSKKDSSKNKVFAYIYNGFLDLAIVNSGKLVLYNNFKYQDSSDLVYFLLGVYKQLGLNLLEDEIIIGGLIEKSSDEINILNQYLGKVKLDKLNEDFTYSYTFNKIPSHSFTNIFNLYNCGS